MFVHLDPVSAFQLFCVVQGLTTAAYVFAARPRSTANVYLGILLVALTLQVVDYFLSRSGVYYRSPGLYFSPLFFSWGFGPLLYAHVRSRGGRAARLRLAHWVPVVVQASFYAVLSVQSFDDKKWFWLAVHKPVTRHVEHYVALASLLAYVALSFRWMPAVRPTAFRRWLAALAVFAVAAAVDPLVNWLYLPEGAPLFYLSSLGLPVMVYGLVLLGGRSAVARAAPEAAVVPVDAPDTLDDGLHGLSPVQEVDAEQLAVVVQALEIDRIYRDQDLTLDRLAKHVGLAPNAVSYLLNAGLGQSFSNTVNGYRVDEVRDRLLTDDAARLTLLGLALEAGFNSKATFNRVFKERMGVSPRDYQKRSQATL